MRTRRTGLVAPLLLAAAVSLGACGDDENEGSETPTSQASGAADVVVTGQEGIRWDAASYTASAGDVSIVLRNDSSLPHTLAIVAEDGAKVGEELKTPNKGDEQTGTYTLAAGTYTIICTVPGHAAMKADLTVS